MAVIYERSTGASTRLTGLRGSRGRSRRSGRTGIRRRMNRLVEFRELDAIDSAHRAPHRGRLLVDQPSLVAVLIIRPLPFVVELRASLLPYRSFPDSNRLL